MVNFAEQVLEVSPYFSMDSFDINSIKSCVLFEHPKDLKIYLYHKVRDYRAHVNV